MENKIKFINGTVTVDFQHTDHSPVVVRRNIERELGFDQEPFLSLGEKETEEEDSFPAVVRAILILFRQFLFLSRSHKARRHGN